MMNRAVRSLARPLIGGLRRIRRRWSRARDQRVAAAFSNHPRGFVMRAPRSLVAPERMTIGDDVKLGPGSELKCNTSFPGGWMRHPEGKHKEQAFEPAITIGHRVTATASLQVVAFDSVVIEDDVMFAANVFVADGTHGSESGAVPYKYQGISRVAPVRIGRGAWIGQNAVINPGVTIGELAVVGANSVVTRDVPARTIVAGVPARPIRRWNRDLERWERVAADGGNDANEGSAA